MSGTFQQATPLWGDYIPDTMKYTQNVTPDVDPFGMRQAAATFNTSMANAENAYNPYVNESREGTGIGFQPSYTEDQREGGGYSYNSPSLNYVPFSIDPYSGGVDKE